MNEFEEKLRALGFRQPPADLRREILAVAETAVTVRWTWREWLWPSPLAWGALAGVLAVALVCNASLSPGGVERPAATAAPPPEPATLYAFSIQPQDLTSLENRP